jgi:hypothetical protein
MVWVCFEHIRFDLTHEGFFCCVYKPDFRITINEYVMCDACDFTITKITQKCVADIDQYRIEYRIEYEIRIGTTKSGHV